MAVPNLYQKQKLAYNQLKQLIEFFGSKQDYFKGRLWSYEVRINRAGSTTFNMDISYIGEPKL